MNPVCLAIRPQPIVEIVEPIVEIVEPIVEIIEQPIAEIEEVLSINTCSQQSDKHCSSCVCFDVPVEVSMVSLIKKQMAGIQYETSKELPKGPIRDIELSGLKMLETDTNGDKLLRDVEFKQYQSKPIEKRVIKEQFPFDMKLLSQIEKMPNHQYMNFKDKINNYEAVMKFTIENNIQYSAETFNPTLIAYDIESFHPTDKTVIPTHLNGGIMAMICAAYTKKDTTDSYFVYILDQYNHTKLDIEQSLIERRTEAKHPQPKEFTLDIIKCQNQTVMACSFLDDIKSVGISILYGFNSSSTIKQDQRNEFGAIVKRETIGYDLPMILHNSGRYTQEIIEHGCKLYGKTGKQIKQISWLPNTYILDCSVIFQNSRYFAMNLSDMPNRKLNSFLEFAQIPLKADDMTIHERMTEMRNKGSNLTSTISYCLWDSYALTLVMNKIQFLDTIKANIDIFNIPLSWALFKNASNWITMYMLRKFYDSGFSYSYAKFEMSKSQIKFRGATTESCPQSLQLSVIPNILMGDYESLYPNSIICANLGIDSLLDNEDDNCYKININYIDKYLVEQVQDKVQKGNKLAKQEQQLLDDNDMPKFVYFSKTQSVYAKIVQDVLIKRLQTKTLMKSAKGLEYDQLDARQNALKILVNTIYGLSGCQTFQLYDERVASACTAIARQLTEIAKESNDELKIGQCVFRDTDSCGIMNVQPDVKLIKEQFKALNQLINDKLEARIGNTHRFNFVPEIENYQLATYFPIAKKAYARLELNLLHPEKPSKLKIKGVSWSLMSEYGKQMFNDFTKSVLSSTSNKDQIQDSVKALIETIRLDINTLIATKNYSEIARKYHKQIKNSANNKTAIYLRQRFNIQENEIQMLPIVKSCKLKSQCVIPVSQASKHQINANQLLDWFISPIVKFFGKQEYECQEYDELEQLMTVRLATQNGYMAKFKSYGYSEIADQLDNKSQSMNECIGAVNKLFFDIDDSKNETNFAKCLELIEQTMCKFSLSSLHIKMAYTKSTSTTKPHSYHVVYQIKSSIEMNKYIALEVNKLMGFEIIDNQLYSLNKTLRLPNSPKYCEKTKKLIQVYHHMVQGTLEQMYISDIADVQNQLSSAVGFINQPHKQIGYKSLELDEKYTIALKEYLKFNYTIKPTKDNCFTIIPDIKPFDCPICNRKHDTQNLKMYIRSNGFVIDCWATNIKTDKQMIKHSFEKYDKLKGAAKRAQQLQNAVDRTVIAPFKDIDSSNIEFQHNASVQYNLNSQATFVISEMMTEKTKQQIRLTSNDEFQTILALSFRRTFARDNASKNQFVNYEDVKGKLSLIDYPKLIIQVDSLARLDLAVKPQLLIVDEIESIIEQLTAIKRDTTPYILHKFIELIQSPNTKVLFLDAALEQSTIKVLTSIMQTDNYRVFVNTYQPKTDYNIVLQDYVCNSGAHKNLIIEQVKQLVYSGKKVVVSSTSSKLSEAIKMSIGEDKIIKYYDGEDAKKYDNQSMAKIKHEDFKDVTNAWKDCDVLIYTGTLTAGVSFELKHFDVLIGVFSKMTSSPLAFTQGLHRVRNLNDKQIYLYLEHEYATLPQTAYDITDTQTQIYGHCDLSEISQFNNWITAANNQNKNQSVDIVIRNLKQMGYKFEVKSLDLPMFEPCIATRGIHDLNIIDIANAKITVEDLTVLPKLMKDTSRLMADTDNQLHAKYQKVKLFKSYFHDHSQVNIDTINGYNSVRIRKLVENRTRIAENNKIKNTIKKCVGERPELINVTIDQTNLVLDAMKLESKYNIKAQLADTVSKNSILKFSNEVYQTIQAIKCHNLIKDDISQENLAKAVDIMKTDLTLKKIGLSFTKHGDHVKLNELLKFVDVEINLESTKQVKIQGVKSRNNVYSIKYISAADIIKDLNENKEYDFIQANINFANRLIPVMGNMPEIIRINEEEKAFRLANGIRWDAKDPK